MAKDAEDDVAPALLAAVLVARGKKAEAEALRDRTLAGIQDEDARRALRERFDSAITEAEAARKAELEAPPGEPPKPGP
jgi:hypothetical protein